MSPGKITFGVLALLALFIAFREGKTLREVQSELKASVKDRNELSKKAWDLTKRLDEAEQSKQLPPPAPPTEIPRAPDATPVVEVSSVLAGVTTVVPAGWSKNGSKVDAYAVGMDQNQTHAGEPSAYVKSLESSIDGFGGIMQMASAADYGRKRVRYSAWAKTEGADTRTGTDPDTGGGHLWFRIDGERPGQVLGFDNMGRRPIKGTTDWRLYSLVLDVPADAKAFAYGFFLIGVGQMWVTEGSIEEVGPEVPVTVKNITGPDQEALPKPPNKLKFE